MISAVLLVLAGASCQWTVQSPNMVSLPYLMMYGACFEPKSEVAQNVMRQDGIGPAALSQACQSRQQVWLDEAIKAVRASGSDDVLQQKRALEAQFRLIERKCAKLAATEK